MSEDRIKDIPKLRKLVEDMKMLSSMRDAMPIIGPILRQFGVDVDKMNDVMSGIKELEKKIEDAVSIPDRFNDLFAARGWIMYDLLNMDTAVSAVEKAEAGNIEEAEQDLVHYYDARTVKWKLQTMIGVKAFRPRMELAKKALRDYEEERYYASTLVILALIDGLVSELSSNRRGFAAEEVDLHAWDSIAGHSKGLNALVRMFQKGRRTLCADEITIPYRNGIMHGMDLGFDNKMVAAKTWAALFAVRDWALKAQKAEIVAPPEEPKPTLIESLQLIQEVATDKVMMEAWRPRNIVIGEVIPASGNPSDYEEDSPERVLIEFLSLWKARNYGKMSEYLTYHDKKYYGKKLPKSVSDHYRSKALKSYKLVEFLADDVNMAIIKVQVVYIEGHKEIDVTQDINIAYEDDLGKPSIRGKKKEGHGWVIYTAYL